MAGAGPPVSSRVTLAMVLLSLGAALMGCHSNTPVDALHHRTILLKAPATDPVMGERTSFAVTYSWTVRSRESWSAYRAGLIEEFSRDHRIGRDDDTGLVFIRQLSGDLNRLTIAAESSDDVLRLRVVCESIAD